MSDFSAMLQGEKIKPTKKRIELLRAIPDTSLINYITKIDSCTDKKVLTRELDHPYNFINKETADIKVGGTNVYWTVIDLIHQKERELNKIAREALTKEKELKVVIKNAKVATAAATTSRYMNLPALAKALKVIGDDFEVEIFASNFEYLQKFVAAYYPNGTLNLTRPTSRASRNEFLRYGHVISTASKFTELSGTKLLDNWKDIIREIADREAVETVASFKYKLANKLGAVIDRKGGDVVIKRDGNLTNHAISLKFGDGSGFLISTQQVISRSVLGKLFARYPSTFHNVILSDGTRMSIPSAAKMQKEFGVDATE